MTDPSLPG